MAKSSKLTLYFLRNEGTAIEKIQKLQEEFPEVKIVTIRDNADSLLIYYDIKCPVKLLENLQLYLSQNKFTILRRE